MGRPRKTAVKKPDALLTPQEVGEIPVEEQPYALPEGWKWIHWGNAGYFIAGNVFKPNLQGKKGLQYPFYKVGSLKYSDHNGYLYDIENSISKDTQKAINSSIIPEYSIIFAKIGEAIRLNRRSINEKKCCIDNNLVAFIPKKVIYKYAYYWALSIDLYKYTNATTVPAIRKTDLEKILFPLPPLCEQQRIVERIESLFAKLKQAKEQAEAVLDGFEARKAAILHKAFTGELTREIESFSTWREKTAEELFTYVTSGSRGWAKYYAEEGAVFLRMGNLDHGTIELDLSDIQHVQLPERAEGQRSRLQKNDILISITADVGMVGLVRDEHFEGYINQHIALARPAPNEDAEFLAWYLVSDVGLSQMKQKERGATKVGLGLDDIRTMRLKMPSVKTQKIVVKIIESLLAKEQQAKEAAETVLEQIELIKKSILGRAFRGELTSESINNSTD